MKPAIVLGSSSKWRKEVLSKMGYEFVTMSPDIDEQLIRDSDPTQLTLKIARAKAQALLPKISEPSIVITSDQVVVWNGQIREKPGNKQQCREFLTSYARHPAECVTAVVITNTSNSKTAEGVAYATQFFHELPSEFIESLIEQGDVMSCSGGFAIEHMQQYLKHMEGEQETITGLPKTLTKQLLQQVQ